MLLRRSIGWLGRDAGGGAENVRPQLVDGDGAVGGALDGAAPLNRNPLRPLEHSLTRYSGRFRKGRSRAETGNKVRLGDHATKVKRA